MAKKIVIVGGGFAGLHLVRRLEGLMRQLALAHARRGASPS